MKKTKYSKLEGILNKTFNKLAQQEEEKWEIKKLKIEVKKTPTKTLKKFISNRTNEQWNYKCSIANDELIRRGVENRFE